MNPSPTQPAETVVAELYKRLDSTLSRLSAHIAAHGMLDDREDETLAFGVLALKEAREAGIITAEGGFNNMMGIVPLDDETRDFADSMLDDTMIGAGMDALERIAKDGADHEQEIPGERPDWDQGMVAVAIYRAMTRSSRLRPYACVLEIDDRETFTQVEGTSPQDAARVFAMRTFHANEGEWMGGQVMVLQMPLGDCSPDLAFNVFGGRYDTTIEFPSDRNPHATAERVAR